MKIAVAVILALAMAVNARQLTWSREQMAAMGYPTVPTTVAPENTATNAYGMPIFVKPVKPMEEVDPEMTAPFYGKPYFPVSQAGDDDVIDPFHGYYVKPVVDDTAKDPVACFYKKHFSCDAPEEVSPTCGTETCTLPNLCLTVKKTVKKMIEVPVTECADPKLVCKEISKECGDTSCAYNEVCKVNKVCKKVFGYPYPEEEVDPTAMMPIPPPYPYPYPVPVPLPPVPDVGGEKAVPSSATAKAVATSTGGPASASAVAKAGGKSLLGAFHKYPAKEPAVDAAAVDPAFPYPAKVICKDVFSCEEVDPKVCKTVTHEVCVKKDPKTFSPGFYNGYQLLWAQGYKFGQPCGGSVCEAGSFCATCDVEVCKDAIMEKDAAQCGFDAKGVPTFCPAGHMCTELCAPVKKYIAVEVEVPVCVDPTDATYADEVAAAVTECGPHKCLPGYECNSGLVKVCGAYEDPAEEEEDDKMHGYYFYFDPTDPADDDEDKMPGYYWYPHGKNGDASGCGYYVYEQDIEVDDAVVPEPMNPFHFYTIPDVPTVDDSAAMPDLPFWGLPYPEVDPTAKDPWFVKPLPVAPMTGGAKPVDPWIPKPVDPWIPKPVDPWIPKPVDPWIPKPVDPWIPAPMPVAPMTGGPKPVDPWVPTPPPPPPPAEPGKVQAVAKSTGDSVYVWGNSNTKGDASGHFNAFASSGDDTHAKVDGGSGPGDDGKGTATVLCDAFSKDGKAAGCDGSATHN